ncbi:MAG: hypothetical protein RLZZ436_2446 [Planctomycetota bacterium]|jgi:hypothetical protein
MVRSKPVELKSTFEAMLFCLPSDTEAFRGLSARPMRASAGDEANQPMLYGLSMRIRVCSLTC